MKIYSVSGNRFMMGSEDIDVVSLCNKYECDGYLKINSHQISLFNKDNTNANLCVNGLHCFTQYLYELNQNYKIYALVMNHEVYKSEIINEYPFISKLTIKYPKIYRNFVNVGNNHMVIFENNYDKSKIYCARYDCNINYVKIINRKCIEVKTYERGVGFTLSCGSGNVSSAVYCYENDLCDYEVEVINDGGNCFISMGNTIEISSISKYEKEV